MRKFIKTGIVILLTSLSLNAFAKVAVVVHPTNSSTLNAKYIKRIFMGKKTSFLNGGEAVPISQAADSATTEAFNSEAMKKTSAQLKAYWSKMIFTGKGTPPKEVASDAEVLKLVAANPNLISYIDESAVDSSVKVVATF